METMEDFESSDFDATPNPEYDSAASLPTAGDAPTIAVDMQLPAKPDTAPAVTAVIGASAKTLPTTSIPAPPPQILSEEPEAGNLENDDTGSGDLFQSWKSESASHSMVEPAAVVIEALGEKQDGLRLGDMASQVAIPADDSSGAKTTRGDGGLADVVPGEVVPAEALVSTPVGCTDHERDPFEEVGIAPAVVVRNAVRVDVDDVGDVEQKPHREVDLLGKLENSDAPTAEAMLLTDDSEQHQRYWSSLEPAGNPPTTTGVRDSACPQGTAAEAEQGNEASTTTPPATSSLTVTNKRPSWGSKAHGIWHRDRDPTPAQKVDGEWVDVGGAAGETTVVTEQSVTVGAAVAGELTATADAPASKEDLVEPPEGQDKKEDEEISMEAVVGETVGGGDARVFLPSFSTLAPASLVEGRAVELRQDGEEESVASDDGTSSVLGEDQSSELDSPTMEVVGEELLGGGVVREAGLEAGGDSLLGTGEGDATGNIDDRVATRVGVSETECENSCASYEGGAPGDGQLPDSSGIESETAADSEPDVAIPAAENWSGFGDSFSLPGGAVAPKTPASPDDTEAMPAHSGAAALDAVTADDWGDFGGAAVVLEGTVAIGAAEQDGVGNSGDGNAEKGDDWSAFEAPSKPSSAQTPAVEVPRPLEEVSSPVTPDGGTALGGVEETKSGRSEPQPLPASTETTLRETPLPLEPLELHGATGKSESSGDWGAFEQVPADAAPEEASGLPRPVDSNGTDPSSLPIGLDVVGDTEPGNDRGDFADSPHLAASVAVEVASEATVPRASVSTGENMKAAAPSEAATGEALDAEEGTPSNPAVVVEGGAFADAAPGDDGDEEKQEESEDEWSDFGDFEEAPTPAEGAAPSSPEVVAPGISKAALGARGETGRVAVGQVAAPEGGSGWNAFAEGGTGGGQVEVTASVGVVQGDNKKMQPSLPSGDQTLTIATAVFDRAFEAEGSVSGLREASSCRGLYDDSPLDALVDFALLLGCMQQPSSRRDPVRLSMWATSCILHAIRPVPDSLTAADEEDIDTTTTSSSNNNINRREAKEASSVPIPPAVVQVEAVTPTPAPALPNFPSPKCASLSTPVRKPAPSQSPPPPPPQSPPPRTAPSETAAPMPPPKLETIPPPLPVKHETAKSEEERRNEEVVDQANGVATSFASFPIAPEQPASVEPDLFAEDGGEPSSPPMPRYPPPRVPSLEGDGERDVSRGGTPSSGDGSSGGGAVDDAGASEDGGDWGGGDPFDDFQSAPAAEVSSSPPSLDPPSASPVAENPTPPPEAPAWNLDFFLSATPSRAVGTEAGAGGLLPAPGLVGGVIGEREPASGTSLDLVSQALAGFGIASSPAKESGGGPSHPNTAVLLSRPRNSVAGEIGGGDGDAEKGLREGVSSAVLSDLLRSTRLRGGGGRGSRSPPPPPLSAAAQSRLAILPDLSFMLSDRLRFPMRATEMPPATGVE